MYINSIIYIQQSWSDKMVERACNVMSTYEERRMHILSVTASVEEFLTEYPALAHPAMVCL